jgi:hypothetical protein
MICPNCKRDKLLPARTRENSPAIDGKKCANCGSLYRVNGTNHLEPLFIGQIPGGIPLPEVDQPTPEKPQQVEQPKVIVTAAAIKQDSPARVCKRLTEEQKAMIIQKLAANESPSDIAVDVGCGVAAVGYYKYKDLGVHRNKKSGEYQREDRAKDREYTTAERLDLIDECRRDGVAAVGKKYDIPRSRLDHWKRREQFYRACVAGNEKTIVNNSVARANVLSQVAQLKRGKISPSLAKTILQRYGEVLKGDYETKVSEARAINEKIKSNGDALAQLDAHEEEERKGFAKILELVG